MLERKGKSRAGHDPLLRGCACIMGKTGPLINQHQGTSSDYESKSNLCDLFYKLGRIIFYEISHCHSHTIRLLTFQSLHKTLHFESSLLWHFMKNR